MPVPSHDDPPFFRPNRMMDRAPRTAPMDLLGLRHRHDETFRTHHPQKEDPMNITLASIGKDTPAGNQSSTSTLARYLQYLRERPDDVAAVSERLGPNATITEIVMAVQALDTETIDSRVMAFQGRYVRQSQAMVDRVARGEAENRQKAAMAELLARLQTPPSKIPTPGYQRIY